MEIPTNEEIVGAIDAFLARHDNMPPTRFGREATKNQNIVADLRRGHEPSLGVLRRLKAYMALKDAERAAATHAASDTTAPGDGSAGKSDDLTAPESNGAARAGIAA